MNEKLKELKIRLLKEKNKKKLIRREISKILSNKFVKEEKKKG